MYRTFLSIPHEIAGIPVMGFGWLLMVVGIAMGIRLLWAKKLGIKVGEVIAAEGMMWGIVAVAVVFVLPNVELRNVDGEPVGLAIRGYGFMLLLAVSSAVGLTAVRAKNRGIPAEEILSLAPWVFGGGLVGARLFYVIQYSEKFIGDSIAETLGKIFRFTEGGLVVYGSMIGGVLAFVVYASVRKLPVLKLGDAIAPCIFLGVCLGRIGCLFNGCCYGGRCEEDWSTIRFPPGSAVYHDQLLSGELLGLTVDPETREISSVRANSLAAESGIESGEKLGAISYDQSTLEQTPRNIAVEDVQLGVTVVVNGLRYRWASDELPAYALPVRAAQLLSSVSALILCLILLMISRRPLPEGSLLLIGFAGYAVVRFCLEIVRVDEGGQFGTKLSISQWVSIVVLILSVAGTVWLWKRPDSAAKSSE